jgi:hypothetical protein
MGVVVPMLAIAKCDLLDAAGRRLRAVAHVFFSA